MRRCLLALGRSSSLSPRGLGPFAPPRQRVLGQVPREADANAFDLEAHELSGYARRLVPSGTQEVRISEPKGAKSLKNEFQISKLVGSTY